jgi:hypothetical protein
MIQPKPINLLVVMDNTLPDNVPIQDDIKRHLEREFGTACRERYKAIITDSKSVAHSSCPS